MSNGVEVLLVEDNPRDLELTMRALRQNHVANNLHVAVDGEEALDYIFARGKYSHRTAGDGPTVVFLDLKLPKVDGIEVLRAMKSDERTKSIPVVMVTSSKEERDLIESYRLGVNSYVVKPIDFDGFVKTIADLGFYWLVVNQAPREGTR